MTHITSDIAFTPAVKSVQERLGSRTGYARMEAGGGWKSKVDPGLAAFIAERDSFYLGTASASGRPYIQHRGGAPGFLKVIDSSTLAFADYTGNRQYISTGNLSENDQAYIFLMDYPNRRRVKIWGRARAVEDDPDLLLRLVEGEDNVTPERAIVFQIEAWDVNCPQHIEPRFTDAQIAPRLEKLQRRIAELESELETLRPPNQDRPIA